MADNNPYSGADATTINAAAEQAFGNKTPVTPSDASANPYSTAKPEAVNAAAEQAFGPQQGTAQKEAPGQLMPYDMGKYAPTSTPAPTPQGPAQTPNANSWIQDIVQGNPGWAQAPKQPDLMAPPQMKPFNPMLPVPPRPGYMGSIANNAKAAASAVIPGAITPFEQIANLNQFAHNQFPPQMSMASDWSQGINALNRVAGAPPNDYMDVAGQMNRTPQSWLGGQTPTQAQEGNPIGTMAGNLIGSAPLMALPGGAAARGVPLLGKIAANAGIGGLYGGGFSALDEAGNQIKTGTINIGNIANAARQGGLFGAGLGGIAGGLIHGLPKVPGMARNLAKQAKRAYMRPGLRNAAMKQGQAALERHLLNQRGNTPHLTPEQEEYLAKGGTLPMPKDLIDTFNRELHPAGPKKQPKLIEKKPLVPPSPSERARMAKEGYVPPFKLHVEENIHEGPRGNVPAAIDKEIEKFFPEDSWRQRRSNQARPAIPVYEDRAPRAFAEAKTDLDKAEGQLYGAIEQLEDKLHLEPKSTHYIKPELDKLRVAFIKEHGGKVTKTTPNYLEATLAPGHEYPKEYKFKTDGLINQMGEVRALAGKVHTERVLLDKAKAQLMKRPDLIPENDTIQMEVKDKEGNTKLVNIRNRKQAAAGGIEFPTQELQRGYEDLKAKLEKESGPYYVRTAQTFRALINKELKAGNQTLEYLRDHGALDWFNDLGSSTQAKVILTTGLAASMYLNSQNEAQAAPPANLFGKVLSGLKRVNWEEAEGFKPITRITGTQMTTDVLRQGFDKTSRAFARERSAYLGELDRHLAFGRKVTPEEAKIIKKLSPGEISSTPLLKGWTNLQKQKLAESERLHRGYTKKLQAEIERVDKLGAKPGMTGVDRYSAMLHFDLKDMTGVGGSAPNRLEDAFNKLTGSIYTSAFWGNDRAMWLHIWESMVANFGMHPLETVKVLHKLAARDDIYTKFVGANSPRGMFQRVLEDQEKFGAQKKIDKYLNEPIDNFIKSLPHGKVIYDALSAQLGERGKLGITLAVSAEANAKNYPRGPEQFMKDWLANAKENKAIPPERLPMFAKVEVANFENNSEKIMYMPDGLISERTMFQRHGPIVDKSWPLLRAIAQQGRFFALQGDDLIAGLRSGNHVAAIKAFRAMLIGHLIISGIAGHHVFPDYIWSIFESIDKEGANRLRDAIDDRQKVVAGGMQSKDFGVKYFPWVHMPGTLAGSVMEKVLKNINPKDPMAPIDATIDALAMGIINRIGPMGTINIEFLANRLFKGMQGYQDYSTYTDNPLMDKIMGRQFVQKTNQAQLPYGYPQALLQWLVKVNLPEELEVQKQGEEVARQMSASDAMRLQQNWANVFSTWASAFAK